MRIDDAWLSDSYLDGSLWALMSQAIAAAAIAGEIEDDLMCTDEQIWGDRTLRNESIEHHVRARSNNGKRTRQQPAALAVVDGSSAVMDGSSEDDESAPLSQRRQTLQRQQRGQQSSILADGNGYHVK